MKAFKKYGVTLQPLTQEWIEQVRVWRNDPNIAQHMLDQREITPEQQQAWFDGLQGDSSRQYWLAWFKEEPIGVVSLLAIDTENRTAEPGMYIYPERYKQNIVPYCVGFALNDYAFEELGLTLLYGKVFADNGHSIRFHESQGYQQVSQQEVMAKGAQETQILLEYELKATDYFPARDKIAHFIRYD